MLLTYLIFNIDIDIDIAILGNYRCRIEIEKWYRSRTTAKARQK